MDLMPDNYKCPKCNTVRAVQQRCPKCDRWMLRHKVRQSEIDYGHKLNRDRFGVNPNR